LRCGNFFNLYPKFNAEIESVVTNSHIYGGTLEDIIIMCISGELGSSNDEPFDTKTLDVCADFVNECGADIGLTTESNEVPQKGMFRCNQPQVVCVITKS
ncbi:MAG: hypothetical protein M1511_02830, partial [Deltaproteobacteria bacterium]|nr:hypothetical protein [Deltaproteobacteria bacterium]